MLQRESMAVIFLKSHLLGCMNRVEKIYISHEAGEVYHNLLHVFMNKKIKFCFKFQNFPANINIFFMNLELYCHIFHHLQLLFIKMKGLKLYKFLCGNSSKHQNWASNKAN